MPRAEQSTASKILEFFEKTPLDTANLVMDLAKDKLRARNQKSQEAKAKAATNATAAPAKAAKKKKGKAKTAAPATVGTSSGPSPLPPSAGSRVEDSTIGDLG